VAQEPLDAFQAELGLFSSGANLSNATHMSNYIFVEAQTNLFAPFSANDNVLMRQELNRRGHFEDVWYRGTLTFSGWTANS